MAVTTRLQPLDKDIAVVLSDTTPQGRANILREFASEQIKDATQENRQPPQVIVVDGKRGASLEEIRADSTIVATWRLLAEVLIWIAETLVRNSPVSAPEDDPDPSVAYSRSHKLFADGVEVSFTNVAFVVPASEYTFTNAVKYARKIETGASSQAPDGVYQATAELARKQFGNIAQVIFAYVTITDAGRQPAIIVRGR